MRLKVSKSKNAASLYVIKSVYNPKTQSNTSKIVEKLGTEASLRKKLNGRDPYKWAKEYIEELNRKEEENKREILVKYSPVKFIEKDKQFLFNGGYLFLESIYHDLGINNLCKGISDKYKFKYDLNSILSRLIYSRILFPASKLGTFKLSKKFIDQPKFKLHHIYRALEVLAKEMDYVQSWLYTNSLKISKRNTGVLYYDCTNFFFDIEQESGLKQYGISKEHRPNPIVQMGLFMDGDGIPLAFNINKGNTNEQLTLKPLEKKILKDFNLSKFVVCTDAGLASQSNRKFNDKDDRAFITTQSIKKLKKHLKTWALDSKGWHLVNDNTTYDISNLDEDKYFDKIFYKQRWIKENDLEQKLIVTFSLKYKDYQREVRNSQIQRAQKLIDKNPKKIGKLNKNDYKRFIKKTSVTKEGEKADKEIYTIHAENILKDEAYDGFYAVCTNLDSSASEIIEVNKNRWQIEECFRIMKSEFKARPVYLSRDDRIKAHFTTCFMSLIIYKLLEKKLEKKYTCSEIIDNLKDMNFYKVDGEGFVPTYTRNDFTDDLHETFGFRTDYQILNKKHLKNIFKQTKN